jgi:hypothetical protein
MLLRNGEILNVEKAQNDTEKWVKSEIKNISESNKVFVFTATMKPVILSTDTGSHTDHRFISIPCETRFVNPKTGMEETWRYVGNDVSIKTLQGGIIEAQHGKPFIISTSGTSFPSNTKAEEIFFLKEISKSIKNRKIIIEDKELEAKQNAEKELMEASVKMMILSPDSIISIEKTGNSNALKNIASYFGVDNIETKSNDVLKLNLWDSVQWSQNNYLTTKKGYKEFIEMANQEGDHERRSLIILAIQRGLLIYKDSIWFVKLKGGGQQHLVSVPYDKEDKKEDLLVRFLLTKDNNYFYKLVEETINSPEPLQIMNSEPKSNKTWIQLRKKITEDLGYKPEELKGKKQIELEKILANKIKPNR